MVAKPTSQQALEVLQICSGPVNVISIIQGMAGNPCRSTVARALRRMRAKGIVSSERNGGRWVLWSFKQLQPAKVRVNKQQAKGPVRRNVMCRPDNMPTLCKAIDEQVALFIADKKEFSAFDVTKALREKVAKAAIDKVDSFIDDGETGTVYVAGVSVAKIDHDIVKEAVHDLFKRDEMPGFERAFNGSHWMYAEEQAPTTPVLPDDSVDPVVDVPAVSGTTYDGSSSL